MVRQAARLPTYTWLPPLVLGAVLGIGCQEHKVTAFNSEPVATISSHTRSDALIEGKPESFLGMVSDDDDAVEELSTTWRIGDREVCVDQTPQSDGTTECTITLESDDIPGDMDQVTVSLTVSDPRSANHTARVELNPQPNLPPVVDILSPTDGARFYADEPVTFHGTVADPEDHETDLLVWWESSVDPDLPFDTEATDEGVVLNTTFLSVGQHTVTLKAEDSGGRTTSESVNILVQEENRVPTCSISTPATDAVFQEGASVQFSGVATDPDVSPNDLVATWESDRDGILNANAPLSDGTMEFTAEALTSGAHRIQLTVDDDRGLSCTDSIDLSVRAKPRIDAFSPEDGTFITEGTDTTLTAVVSDLEDDPPDTLVVAWSSDLHPDRLGTDTADTLGRASIIATDLVPGEHLITITVTDSDAMTATEAFLLVVNQPPTRPEVSLSPTSASTTDDLLATISLESFDPEGESVSYTYAWSRDGEPSLFSTTDRLTADGTAKGQRWTISVTPNDGHTDGPTATATTEILNSAPRVDEVRVSPDTASTSSTLTCTASGVVDDDRDAVSVSYRWYINDVPHADASSTLEPTAFSSGDQIACEATPHDDEGAGDAVRSETIRVNVPPVVHSVFITPPTPSAGDDLLCNADSTSDVDGEPVTVRYGWTINGIDSGESTETLSSTLFVRDDRITCTATPSDGIEDGLTVVSEPIVILNTAPTVGSVSISPADPKTSDVLLCSATGLDDVDSDAITVTYQWVRNDTLLDLTSPSLSPDLFEPGDIIACEATPNDDAVDGPTLRSESVQINVPPIVHTVTLSPELPKVADTLVCTAGLVTDGDGDDVMTRMQWFVNGIDIGVDTAALTDERFIKSDEVYCQITPFDGAEDGISVASETVVIQNTPPTVAGVFISPTAPRTTDTIVCSAPSASDADLDTVNIRFRWLLNGTELEISGEELPPDEFTSGDDIACEAIPNDGTDDGPPVRSETVAVNIPPVVHTVHITPSEATVENTLTCHVGLLSDDDDDAVSARIEWFINDVGTGVETATLAGSVFARADAVHCVVTPFDGAEDGVPVAATPVVIDNAVPQMVRVDVSPADAFTNSTLTANATGADADMDALDFHYDWFVNGVSTGATTNTLSGEMHFVRGDAVHVVVTAHDGLDISLPMTTETISINNTAPSTPGISISPIEPAAGSQDLICMIDTLSEDPDLDSIHYDFEWTVDGTPTSVAIRTTYNGDTIPQTETRADETWTCTVTATDDEASSDAAVFSVVPEWRYLGWEEESLLLDDVAAELYGTGSTEEAGTILANAGDIDGDGYNDLLIGAPWSDEPLTNSGRAYLALAENMVDGLNLEPGEVQIYEADQRDVLFGHSLAGHHNIAGTGRPDIAIGAYKYDLFDQEGIVAVYFDGGPASITPLTISDADVLLYGATEGEQAGYDLDFVSDMNDDGYAELLVGAPFYDGPGARSGAAYLVKGSDLSDGGTFNLDDSTRLVGETGLDWAGTRVASGGDLNGDGIAELIIAATRNSLGGNKAGAVFIVDGDRAISTYTLMLEDADHKLLGEADDDRVGTSIDGNFDVDGDGFKDILIGAPLNDHHANSSGRAYLVLGSTVPAIVSASVADASAIFESDELGAKLGNSVSGGSDIDNDGLADIAIGVPNSHLGGPDAGAAWVFHGSLVSAGGVFTDTETEVILYGDGTNSHAGYSVLGLGDVNGDTFGDLAIGEPNEGTEATNAGLVHIVLTP